MPFDSSEEPRSLAEVQGDLARLRSVKESFVDLPAGDFATEVSLLSVEARESELLAEESSALLREQGGDLELVLDGDAVMSGAVDAQFLATILGRFQGLVNAVAEARAGASKPRGAVQEDIREPVRLMVHAFAVASFGIRLTIPTQPDQLFGPSVLGSTISLFDPDPERGSFLTMLRIDRVRSNFTEIMTSLVHSRSSMAIASRELTHTLAFTSSMARERLDWMELIEVSKEPLTVRGVLIGGNLEKRVYDLVADEQHYSGKVLDTALGDMRHMTLGSDVTARLLVVTKSQADDILPSHTDYYLESVQSAADGQFKMTT